MNEFRTCRCCGGKSLVEEEYGVSEKPGEGTVETIKHTCLICGSDWKTSKFTNDHDSDKVVISYFSFLEPKLKKVIEDDLKVNIGFNYMESESGFDYFMGDKEVKKSVWYHHFVDRLSLIRSATLN